MKIQKLILFIILLSGLSFAQSDYEKVQNFKNEIAEIQAGIENADSLAVLDSLENEIEQLREEYKEDIELLDKSLYPDNFNTTFTKLNNALSLRRNDFTQIVELEVEVDRLKGELEKLNDKNTELLAEIRNYREIGGSPEEIKNLVNELKITLRKRDQLVRGMVDSLLAEFVNHPMTLSEAEKQEVYEKIETGKLFYNIEKTVRDNIEFLRVTALEAADLGQIKEDQRRFYNLWKKLGPKIAETYSGDRNQSGEVAYITNLFSQWEQELDEEIWKDIHTIFIRNEIEIDDFESGEEFVERVTGYIDNQIEEFDELGYDESYNNFNKFTEVIWKEELRSDWMPILINNEMLTVEQYETVKNKIEEWEKVYDVESSTWWYFVIIIVIVILLIVVFVYRNKMKKKPLEKEEKE